MFVKLMRYPFILVLCGLAIVTSLTAQVSTGGDCSPSESDALGPFYEPDAPVRSRVGEGYLLSGVVRSSSDCLGIAGAKIEFWLAGPDSEYSDRYRATVYADKAGNYTFESHFPEDYAWRPPHIHVRVSAPGHRTLVTQHYPEKGTAGGTFDLVLQGNR